jgi:NAD-dependent SIR2 family protein deacetylase
MEYANNGSLASALSEVKKGNAPKFSLSFYEMRLKSLAQIKPNPSHMKLMVWKGRGMLTGIITQNVDELHQTAGSKSVIAIHGNLKEVINSI